jgi:hypothetical protein
MLATDEVLLRAQRRVQHAAALVRGQQDLVRHLQESGLFVAAIAAQRGLSPLQRHLEHAEAHERSSHEQEGVTA